MKRSLLLIYIVWAISTGPYCSPERKSASYYYHYKTAISGLKSDFEALYNQQAFAAGFTDKSFKYYVMQIITDTLRSNYTTEKRKKELWQNVLLYQYDTLRLKRMAATMKEIKCLWIGKSVYYFGEQKAAFTYISFNSTDKTFTEDKYYILLFTDQNIDNPEMQMLIKNKRLSPIDSLVLFTTTNKYR